jgi:electron transfer flavoprotein beta subunit
MADLPKRSDGRERDERARGTDPASGGFWSAADRIGPALGGPAADAAGGLRIGVAVKLVSLRPEIDRLTGVLLPDERLTGTSPADRAALEWGLRLAELWGASLIVATAGPPPAEAVLREALAAGAHRAVRVDLPADAPAAAVAEALAPVFVGCLLVCCGDYSLDRGTGSMPAFLAGRLRAAQALGLVRLQPGRQGALEAERRLDGGRRERLRVRAPAVVSVEAGVARLRRAPLRLVLAARRMPVEVVHSPEAAISEWPRGRVSPYRPRAKLLSGPDPALSSRQRLLALTGAVGAGTPARVVHAEPEEAADLLVDYLRERGYLGA